MNKIEKEIFASKTNVYKNVFADFEKFIPLLENEAQSTWATSTVVETEQSGFQIRENSRKSKHAILKGSFEEATEIRALTKKLFNSMMPILNDYLKQYGGSFRWFEDVEFLKYEKGDFLLEHSDATDIVSRKISIVYYLNDDYEGGELVFTKKNNAYAPEKNSLIIFPSTSDYTHKANEVKSGTKYAMSLFIR
jgi:predicted 2-oxoglutarate/Fe(II)-dependent dioxygenase YbiX